MNAQLAERLPSLQAIDAAREALAKATTLEDVKALSDLHAAKAALTEVAAGGSDLHAESWALMQEANRRLGQVTRALPKAKPGPRPKAAPEITSADESIFAEPMTKGERLAAAKITARQAHEAEIIAALPEPEFKARVSNGKVHIKAGKRPPPVSASSSAPGYDGDECSTPAEWVERVRTALGGRIAFDPFSNMYAQNVIRADRFYTKEDSSLVAGVSWEHDNAFIQPPYSATLVRLATERFLTEWAQEHLGAAIVLVNNATETEWFQSLADACSLMCLPKKRIQFEYKGEPIQGSNRYAQAFFYFGKDHQRFHTEFHQHGAVFAPVRGFF